MAIDFGNNHIGFKFIGVAIKQELSFLKNNLMLLIFHYFTLPSLSM